MAGEEGHDTSNCIVAGEGLVTNEVCIAIPSDVL